MGADQNLCEGDADVILDADIASTTASYQWFLDGFIIASETNATLTVASPNSGVYSVEVTDESCSILESVEILFNPLPDTSFSINTTCTGATATILGDSGGLFSFNPAATDGAVIDENNW